MQADNRKVVLLKSRETQNRFYVLAPPESGWKNADLIDRYPDDVLLGIAYPCLEDGLNDFATIRTTFETLDFFPEDQDLRKEMMAIINEARENLRKRLTELRDRIARNQAHFLGTDLNEFKEYTLTLCRKGAIRRTLDNMMKLDVFETVAETEAQLQGTDPEPMYYYEFRPEITLKELELLPPRSFVVRLFDDIISAVDDDASFISKYTFDKNVFQKFIALMFINYATTEPIFYGTHKADYGVSDDKDMSDTPLYQAVGKALREIEQRIQKGEIPEVITAELSPVPSAELVAPLQEPEEQRETLAEPSETASLETLLATTPNVSGEEGDSSTPSERTSATRVVVLPAIPIMEQRLLTPLNSIITTAERLAQLPHPRAREYSEVLLRAADQILKQLKDLEIISPMAEAHSHRPSY